MGSPLHNASARECLLTARIGKGGRVGAPLRQACASLGFGVGFEGEGEADFSAALFAGTSPLLRRPAMPPHRQ